METVLKKLTDLVGKHRYAILVLVIGIAFMLLPTSSKVQTQESIVPQQSQEPDISQQLEQILSCIQGVGKVQVMLTVQTGEVTVYQHDDDGTVIVTDAERTQNGLIERVEAARFRGAIIVCQGADRPSVRLDVIEAVAGVTGLSTDRITVLKMK